jgi:hypothetical protein
MSLLDMRKGLQVVITQLFQLLRSSLRLTTQLVCIQLRLLELHTCVCELAADLTEALKNGKRWRAFESLCGFDEQLNSSPAFTQIKHSRL